MKNCSNRSQLKDEDDDEDDDDDNDLFCYKALEIDKLTLERKII